MVEHQEVKESNPEDYRNELLDACENYFTRKKPFNREHLIELVVDGFARDDREFKKIAVSSLLSLMEVKGSGVYHNNILELLDKKISGPRRFVD
jgi:hypothetical protein